MKSNRFSKTVAFKEGFVDWVRASPIPWSGEPEEVFYRGRIKNVRWQGYIPRISLTEIKKFHPESGMWEDTGPTPPENIFDFVVLQKRNVRFTSSDYADGRIRFMVLFGITGVIIPKEILPPVHSLAPLKHHSLR